MEQSFPLASFYSHRDHDFFATVRRHIEFSSVRARTLSPNCGAIDHEWDNYSIFTCKYSSIGCTIPQYFYKLAIPINTSCNYPLKIKQATVRVELRLFRSDKHGVTRPHVQRPTRQLGRKTQPPLSMLSRSRKRLACLVYLT